jgi:hypothetical protein
VLLVVAALVAGAFFVSSAAAAPIVPPTISAQPDLGLVAGAGYVTEFSANAAGVPSPTVRWQVAPDRNGPWSDVSGNDSETSTTLVVAASTDNLGDAYRAVFTNSAGTAISRPAKLVSRMDWMRDLGSDIEDVPLNELTIPGAHDMGTYGFSSDGSVSPVSLDGQLSDIDCISHSVCVSYGRAQDPSNTGAEMLADGMRYFDLRICGNDTTGALDIPENWTAFTQDPVTCHGLEGAHLAAILADTRAFVLAHPTEVVMLDFNHEYQVDLFKLGHEIEDAFALPGGGSLLISPTYCGGTDDLDSGECASDLTLRKIWDGHLGNVIVNFENDGAPGASMSTLTGYTAGLPPTPIYETFNIQPITNYTFYNNFPEFWGRLNGAPDSMERCTVSSGSASCFGDSTNRYDALGWVLNTLSTRASFTDTRQFFIQFLQTTPTTGYILDNLGGSLLDMAVNPDIGSNPIIGPALFDCIAAVTNSCFAELRPENVNVLALNFYDRTSFPVVYQAMTQAEIDGCVNGNGTCDLTTAEQGTVTCGPAVSIILGVPSECMYTNSVNFDLIDQVIRFDEYARTPPVVDVSTPTPASANGWYNAASVGLGGQLIVGVSASDYHYPTGLTALSCLDGSSPLSLFTIVPTSAASTTGLALLSDGVHSITCQATDGANQGFNGVGNSGSGPGSAPSAVFKVDTHAPTAAPTQVPSANSAGWNRTDVTVNWNWTDPAGGSGIDPANCTTSSGSSGEGAAITLTASCNDLAGNTGSASYVVKVDKTPPTVSYAGNAGSYSLFAPVAITCTPADSLSGVASNTCENVSGLAWTFGAGPHTLSATATDNAGNVASASTTFTVTVSPADLCTLTRQFVDGSAKYLALKSLPRAVVDALVGLGCKVLTSIVPKLSPAHKQPFVSAYRQSVQTLAQAGWLTPAQATTLVGLAGGL